MSVERSGERRAVLALGAPVEEDEGEVRQQRLRERSTRWVKNQTRMCPGG